MTQYTEFGWDTTHTQTAHGYLPQTVLDLIGQVPKGTRVLDVGCGNGYFAGLLLARGCNVTGIDLSEVGIAQCRERHPAARFEVLSADQTVLSALSEQPFDIVLCTEVIEHLYDPKSLLEGCFAATRPGGRFICSTPFHGFWKNLAMAMTNKFDLHWSPHWTGGHIKFFSRRTLEAMLKEVGFVDLQFRGSGRFPHLWKSMAFACRRP